MKRSSILLLALLLGGCGKIVGIEPLPGHALPVKPASARTTPTADDLLTPRADAAPQRVDELMKRSAPRKADRFDLPPPDGGPPPLAPPDSTGTVPAK